MTYQEKLFISQPEEYRNSVFAAVEALSVLKNSKYIKKVKIAVDGDSLQFGYDLEMVANTIFGENTAKAFENTEEELIPQDTDEDKCDCVLCKEQESYDEIDDDSDDEQCDSNEDNEYILHDSLFKIKVASSFIALQEKINNLEGNMKIIAEELAAIKGK